MKNLNSRLINIIRSYKYTLLSLLFLIIGISIFSLLQTNSFVISTFLSITYVLMIFTYYKESVNYKLIKMKNH